LKSVQAVLFLALVNTDEMCALECVNWGSSAFHLTSVLSGTMDNLLHSSIFCRD